MIDNASQTMKGRISALVEVLNEEQQHYAAMLEMAHRQGRLMTSHDLEGLQDNSQRFNQSILQADELRLRREHLAGELTNADGQAASVSLSTWLQSQAPAIRRALEGPVQAVRRTAGELARANEMNRRLANFCLDLVEEEAALLRRCLLEDPAGCYDRGAQPAQKTQGGVMQHKA